ncbi:hypothetical protein [Sphingobacterium faecium]|uniref:hypothetical protein n=1 Tax=Sphingobacterium faecium TaxID=34087 RepID=UPI00247AD3E9|nr:hypothetical protein [Sphingobacterium faecium]WGQ15597.1 hypothetical protein QG727_04125 [Sphingobacterium faecium]
MRNRINRRTGISSNVNGARNIYTVARRGRNAGSTAQQYGNRRQRYGDMRRSFGMAGG